MKIRARSSAFSLLSVSLVDVNGRNVDNYAPTNIELTTSYQTYTIDFATHFRNYYGGSPGMLDSTQIDRIQFMINPGYASFPVTGANATYNTYFLGIVDIDWIGIGDASCSFALPVELISFTVSNAGNLSARLNWSTASEQNNDYFEVQRSTDGINFSYVATIDGAGNSSSILNYQYLDAGLSVGTYYYRLKEVDFDGDNYFSNIQSVVILNSVPTSVLPSIVERGESIDVILGERGGNAQIVLVDLTGKVYAEYSALSDVPTSIKTKGIPAGIYLIKEETDNQVLIKKIVVY